MMGLATLGINMDRPVYLYNEVCGTHNPIDLIGC